MKSAVIFYSYSGNTAEVARTLVEELKQRGAVDVFRLDADDEADSFLGQCRRAFFKKKAVIKDTVFDVSSYSLICLGTPVWAFGMAPAMRTYIEKCSGVEHKNIMLFTTYGSGTGNNKCLNEMQGLLAKKGAQGFCRFSVSQCKAKDSSAAREKIAQALRSS